MNRTSPSFSKLATFGAMALVVAPLCAAAFSPQIPVWLAILVSVVVGGPLLVISLRMESESTQIDGIESPERQEQRVAASKKFLPTSAAVWEGCVGLLTVASVISVPLLLFLPLFLFMPTGDDWTIVIVRILLVTVAISVSYAWIPFARSKVPSLLRGKLSDAAFKSIPEMRGKKELDSTLQTIHTNWGLLAIAIFAFLVFFEIVNLNMLGIEEHKGGGGGRGRGRGRGFVEMVLWCRDKPNTVKATSALIGVVSLTVYAYRVRRAHVRSESGRQNNDASIE